jgi:hypothetical protein
MRVANGGGSGMRFGGRGGDHQYQGRGGGLAEADQARKAVMERHSSDGISGWFSSA